MGAQASLPARRPWIISPVWDTLFVVWTPLLSIPAAIAVAMAVSRMDLSVLMVLFATGHHLPTFLRTYGDRALFGRYWLRLVAVPLALLAAQAYFLRQGSGALSLVLLAWAPWHAAMQTYGFMRIYDAKKGQISPVAARLDWLICAGGFLTILLWSPHFLYNLGYEAYRCGLPFVPAGAIASLRLVATAATMAVAIAYVSHAAWILGQGSPLSKLKLLLLGTSLVTYFFAYAAATDPVVGLAAWEIFHGVQYYAIVWAYNRRLVEKGDSATKLVTFLFRPRKSLLVLYTGLVFLYGGFDLATSFLPQDTIGQLARSLFVISAILHFYYDGFIWKVRQPKTRQYLDVAGGAVAPSVPSENGGETRRQLTADARQVAYVLTPVVALGLIQALHRHPELALHEALAAASRTAKSLHALGVAYQEQGKPDQAMDLFRQALERDPDYAAAHYELALLLYQQGQAQQSVEHLQQALAEHPTSLAMMIGDHRNPLQPVTRANAHRQLGLALEKLGRRDEALENLWKAWNVRPPPLRLRQEIAWNLSNLLTQHGDFRAAIGLLRDSVAQSQVVPRQAGETEGLLHLATRLARLLATCADESLREPAEALRLAQAACETTQYEDLESLETLAAAHAALGNLQEAEAIAARLVELAKAQGEPAKLEYFRALRQRYASAQPATSS